MTTRNTTAAALSAGQRARLDRDSRWRARGLTVNYNVTETVALSPAVRSDAVRLAVGDVVWRHPALRTVVNPDLATCTVLDEADIAVAVVEVGALDGPEAEEVLRQERETAIDAIAGPPFRAILLRSPDGSGTLAYTVEHLFADAASVRTINRDFLRAYRHRLAGGSSPVWDEQARGYHEYASWESEVLQSDEGERRLRFWRAMLDPQQALPEFRLPGAVVPSLRDRTSVRSQLTLGRSPREVLAAAQSMGVQPQTILATAVMLAMHLVSGTQVPGIVGPIDARRGKWRTTVGWFSTVLPLRAALVSEDPCVDLVQKVSAALTGSIANLLPPAHIVGELDPQRDRRRIWRPRVYLDSVYAGADPSWSSPEEARNRLLNDDFTVKDGLVCLVAFTSRTVELLVLGERGSISQAQLDEFSALVGRCLEQLSADASITVEELRAAVSGREPG
ncbi:condensation domain-containing protein [Kribbella sp. NPDC051718]|uniref:condensation domain-containing protein n=1 Tax=Kribbella sp. NPDC051718 TaxID=3155168 RepID=UPI003424E91B